MLTPFLPAARRNSPAGFLFRVMTPMAVRPTEDSAGCGRLEVAPTDHALRGARATYSRVALNRNLDPASQVRRHIEILSVKKVAIGFFEMAATLDFPETKFLLRDLVLRRHGRLLQRQLAREACTASSSRTA